MENKSTNAFLKNFLTVGAGTLIYMIVGVVGTPIITRLVDPEQYGRVSILSVYSSMGLMFFGLGLDQTLLRFFYQGDIHYQRKLLNICCKYPLMTVLVAIVLVCVAGLLGLQWMDATEAVLLSVNVLVLIVNRFAMLVLRLRSHTKSFSTINIIQKASYIALSVIFVLVTRWSHFFSLMLATILSTIVATVAAIAVEHDIWTWTKTEYTLPISDAALLRYGFPIMLASSITVVFNALDKLFIEHYCTLTDVGVYASAMNLMAVFSVIRTSFNTIWMPSAVEHYENNPEDKRFYQQGNAAISVLMLSFGAAVILFKDLFVLLLGEKYRDAAAIVPFLMFEPIMYTISETTATGIVVQKKTSYQVFVAGGSCLLNFFGNWLLTPIMGPQGAAISTGLSYVAFFTMRTMLSNKVYYVDYHLPKFALMTVLLIVYAVYGSSHDFSLIQVLFVALYVCALVIGYSKDFVKVAAKSKSPLRKTNTIDH